MTTAPPIIQFENVSFRYRGDWLQSIRALENINFSVPRGSSLGFLGANGAGKSTSIKLLLGLLHGHRGRITLFGEEIGKPQLRAQVGYLPEHPFFYENLQVQEYLAYLGQLSGMAPAELKQSCERIYSDLDLGDLRKRKLGSFSKGMRQRFGLAQAIVHHPQLIVLDEPFSGLDPLWRSRFKQIMQAESARGATLFFSSHILADVEDLCDSYVLIDHGNILECGELASLFAEAPLQITGRGPCPPFSKNYQVSENADSSWELICSDEQRPQALAAIQVNGGDILRLERQRIALEDYFVQKVKAYHAAGAAQESEVST